MELTHWVYFPDRETPEPRFAGAGAFFDRYLWEELSVEQRGGYPVFDCEAAREAVSCLLEQEADEQGEGLGMDALQGIDESASSWLFAQLEERGEVEAWVFDGDWTRRTVLFLRLGVVVAQEEEEREWEAED